MSVVGQTDQDFSGRTYFFFAPVLIPFFILGIPILDTAFAILRRAGRRTNPAVADKNHLHHRLMRLGHGQTRSVLILWTWTALLSGLVLYPSFVNGALSFVPIGAAALGVALYTLFGVRGRGSVTEAR
jgi:UDP-GlcNAc:undecaprenyl-phosphate GlcNAc-1-phosphate transferase